jgi:TPP-dependent pyruvate/acetoin dehydrogenase alpha subunit
MAFSGKNGISADTLLDIHRRMVRIRVFEVEAGKLQEAARVPGALHLYVGQEAVASATCACLTDADQITSTHRGHGHLVAKGGDFRQMYAELFGRTTGYCRGKGGSMHICDFAIGMLGANGIVGGGPPIAVGAAFSNKYRKTDQVAVSFFGDGASNEGSLHEAANMAALYKLPVIFLCENNQFAVSTRHETVCSVKQISQRAAAYDIPGETIDGQDALVVWDRVERAAEAARAGGGPVLIEAMTYRYGDHSYLMNRLKYRTDEEVAAWRANDPIANLGRDLLAAGLATEDDLQAIADGVDAEVKAAIEYSRAGTTPTKDHLWERMYSDPTGFPERRHHQAWFAPATSEVA